MKHYEFYSWSAQYRQERLAEAGRLRLEEKLRASREPRGLRNPLKALRKAVASLRATSEPGDPPAVRNPYQLTPRRGLPTTPGTHGGQ
jgi:hypothetical protein